MEKLQQKIGYASDEEIIAKVLAGETAVFEILIRRYNALLYKIARSYGLNHHDAEDLMQEAHFAAYMQLKNFRKECSYKTWITKILLNKCFHKTTYGAYKHEVPSEFINNEAAPISDSIEKQDAEKIVINKELARVLEESLQLLPIIYRSVFVLREIEGFNVAETAEILGVTEVNVKVRLNRAKTMLQKKLEGYYSIAGLYEFHLMYCDKIVKNVFNRIATSCSE